MMLHLSEGPSFEGELPLASGYCAQLAAGMDCVNGGSNCGQQERIALDYPWCVLGNLSCGKRVLPDQASNHGVADTEHRRNLLDGQPLPAVPMIRQTIVVPGVLDAVDAPRITATRTVS